MWKDDEAEGDVSIAFGTLVPFFNTGVSNIASLNRNIQEKSNLIAGKSQLKEVDNQQRNPIKKWQETWTVILAIIFL